MVQGLVVFKLCVHSLFSCAERTSNTIPVRGYDDTKHLTPNPKHITPNLSAVQAQAGVAVNQYRVEYHFSGR